MITYVNKSNTADYSFLYSEVSELLRNHKSDGTEVPFGSTEAVKPMRKLEKDVFTADKYEASRYYILVNDEYKLSTAEEFNPEETYYESDTITSLDELFSYIRDIAMISPRHTRLPIDEDVFVIDTNTRMITVPPAFAKNGISVQGDEISEIVYFKVDRYYDATDLYQQNIFIQWKTPTGAEGVSKPWVIDVESEPGYIIFGWPLSSKITANPGQIQFSVRFYNYDKNEANITSLTYSLSTLTQTATIKPALDFDLTNILSDSGLLADSDDTGLVSDRFTNSPLLGDGTTSAVEPVFIKPEYSLPQFMNLDLDDNGFRTVNVAKNVQATVDDAGQLSYYWRKYNLDTKAREEISYMTTMVESKDASRAVGKLYYIEGTKGYILLPSSVTNFTEWKDDNQKAIYERVSQAIIDSIGRYFVLATNRVRNTTAETRDPMELNEDGTIKYSECIVPRPKKPVVEASADLPEKFILTKDNEFQHTFVDNATKEDEGKLTYQWYYSLSGEEGTFEPIENATEKEFVLSGDIVTEDVLDDDGNVIEKTFVGPLVENNVASGDGYYKVITTNNLNKLSKEVDANQPMAVDSLESRTCRVTHSATPWNVTVVTENGRLSYSLAEIEKIGGLTIKATMPENCGESHRVEGEDTITYQWYHYYSGTGAGLEQDLALSNRGEYKVDGDTLLDNATTTNYYPNEEGYYFCEVTNHYNGTTAKKCSRFISVHYT